MKLYTVGALPLLFISPGFLLVPKNSMDHRLKDLLNDETGKASKSLNFRLYPNPVSRVLFSESINKTQVEEVEIINAAGKAIISN